MSQPWIKMLTGLRRHPKVVRMASALEADRHRIVGGLHSAWSVFDEQSEDGELVGYTPAVLDEEVGWPGFTDAMIAVKWCYFDGNSLFLPEFDKHNGASAKRRAQDADRKRAGRSSASDADKSRTRGDKRREESSQEGSSSLAPSAASDAVLVGAFEGHVEPQTVTPNPVAQFARALISAGIQATSLNPELVAYVEEGGTVEHLLQVAQFDKCRGKGCTYIAKAARGELAERASTITPGGSRGADRKLSAPEQVRANVASAQDADDRSAGFDARFAVADRRALDCDG